MSAPVTYGQLKALHEESGRLLAAQGLKSDDDVVDVSGAALDDLDATTKAFQAAIDEAKAAGG